MQNFGCHLLLERDGKEGCIFGRTVLQCMKIENCLCCSASGVTLPLKALNDKECIFIFNDVVLIENRIGPCEISPKYTLLFRNVCFSFLSSWNFDYFYTNFPIGECMQCCVVRLFISSSALSPCC